VRFRLLSSLPPLIGIRAIPSILLAQPCRGFGFGTGLCTISSRVPLSQVAHLFFIHMLLYSTHSCFPELAFNSSFHILSFSLLEGPEDRIAPALSGHRHRGTLSPAGPLSALAKSCLMVFEPGPLTPKLEQLATQASSRSLSPSLF